jgi:hypothetical protein
VPTGRVEDAKSGSLLHYRPLIIDDQILKENKYSTLKADQHFALGEGTTFLRLIFSPVLYFWRLYFHNGLWRCGPSGFIEAMTGAVYAFLTQAKLYQRKAAERHPNFDDAGRH